MALNMHHLVRGAIQRVNPDSPGDVYVSTGAQTVRGIRTPTFALLPTERLQVQALSHEDLYHLNGLNYAGGLYKLYAYGQFSGVVRPDGKGGDLVRLGAGAGAQWWAIQHVLEWWSGWCSFSINRQVNADTLAQLLDALKNGRVPPVETP